MNATLILIPLAGLGLAGTLVLGGTQGEACKQQAACAAPANAPVSAPVNTEVAEPSVAERSLVRFLGDGQAGVATASAPTATVTTMGTSQAGGGSITAGAVQTWSGPSAVTAAGGVGVAQAQDWQRAENAMVEQRARAAQNVSSRRATNLGRIYGNQLQSGQGRAGSDVDAYTKSLERRIEALERRLLERDHAMSTPASPPSVYYATPGSGARIVRPGGVEHFDLHAAPATPEPMEPMPEVIELEDLAFGFEGEEPPTSPGGRGGVVVTTPDGRSRASRSPSVLAVPRSALPVPPPEPPVAARAPEPLEPRYYALPRGRASGAGSSSGDLSELTRLIEGMRAQVGELQRDLEALRADLSRVRANRTSGER